jgi:hypothetical protein
LILILPKSPSLETQETQSPKNHSSSFSSLTLSLI